jgi:hypothetical protein
MNTAVEFKKALRENVPLLLGFAGGTGSGKTYTAMLVARGLSGGKRFAVIDTENGRSKHYADLFDFDILEIDAPFTPAKYADAVTAADSKGYLAIIVDSMSHEHAGEGGLLDMHDAEIAAAIARAKKYGDDRPAYKIEQAHKMAAWIKPKGEHKKMMQRLLRMKAHVILCFRAEPKVEMVKNDKGRLEVVPKASLVGLDGWIPVSEKGIPYELTASFLLTADKPGVPKPIKLQEQHRPFFPTGKAITEEAGKKIGEWARGGAEVKKDAALKTEPKVDTQVNSDSSPPPAAKTVAPQPVTDLAELERLADMAAANGYTSLETFWEGLSQKQKKVLKPSIEAHKKTAADVDVGNKKPPAAETLEL